MSDPSPTIPPFIPTGPTDEGLPGQIVWDRECIYTFDGAHWGRTPRAVSSGAWDDLYTPEGGPSARFLLVSKSQSLTDLEKEQAQLNIGLLPATTESFGIVRYTDSWMDNGSGDPGDYPVTLTRHAIMELIGNKLVAGTSNVTIAYDVTTGNTSISVSGGGGGGGVTVDPVPTQGSVNAVSSGGVYDALRSLPAIVPETSVPADNILINNHRYLLPVASSGSLNLVSITVEPFGTVELWVDAAAGSSTVWPDWSWLDGHVPPNIPEVDTRYAIEATNDGRTVVAKLKYSYSYA